MVSVWIGENVHPSSELLEKDFVLYRVLCIFPDSYLDLVSISFGLCFDLESLLMRIMTISASVTRDKELYELG